MADDLGKAGRQDDERINVAVAKVGPMRQRVEQELRASS